jgi:2-polyprenyl-6-methoxyphenol hydroxylase-like FAD-dependent oxidoreductase
MDDREALSLVQDLLLARVHDYAQKAASIFLTYGWKRISDDGKSLVVLTAKEIENALRQRINKLPDIPKGGNYTSLEWNRLRVEVERIGQEGYPEWHARIVIVADAISGYLVPPQVAPPAPVEKPVARRRRRSKAKK